MRAKLLFACLALGGLVSCAASAPTGPSTAAVAMASSDPNIGKEFWLVIPHPVSTVPDIVKSDVNLPVGTHFKIDGIEQGVNVVNGVRYPDRQFYYHMILDDGRTVYLDTDLLKNSASAVPPENLAKVSDKEIVSRIIQQSRQSYEGQCGAPMTEHTAGAPAAVAARIPRNAG